MTLGLREQCLPGRNPHQTPSDASTEVWSGIAGFPGVRHPISMMMSMPETSVTADIERARALAAEIDEAAYDVNCANCYPRCYCRDPRTRIEVAVEQMNSIFNDIAGHSPAVLADAS